MEAHLADMESSGGPTSSLAGTSRNTHVEDDDVVFIESVQPPICAPAIPNERNFVFASSKHENPPGTDSTISPSWRDLTSQKGNLCETIVIDDEGDTDTNGGEEKNPTDFIEWGPNGNKSSTKNVDFPIASLSRSKTKTAVGPFNPGRIDVTDAFQNGRFAVHHNPDSWISQSASFPRNMKQREFLVKNNPPQIRNFNFPKDSAGKKFSETYYTRILPNGEKGTRPWLLYSASKDSVFCLYCRLFGEGKNQLRNENGCKDWHHLSHLLSKHDESEMHINNSVKYSKLKSDLENKTNEATEGGEDCVQLLYT